MEIKKSYKSPAIELIVLDNEISLALESAPPVGPDESYNKISSPDHFNKTPFA
jgi:hypothetical protein